MGAVGWFEFSRGPRTPEQLAVARSFFGEEGVLGFSETLADEAAEVFRRLGSPRKRAADVAIGVTASAHGPFLVRWAYGRESPSAPSTSAIQSIPRTLAPRT
jgi:predicted nucleic acid-binding protein